MSDLDKVLRIHIALVKAGVDPEYARVQLKHQADQLGSLSPEDLTAQILGSTPQSHMARKAEEPGAPQGGDVGKGGSRSAEDFRQATLSTVHYSL
jgi:hypothetical protein